MSLHRKIFTSSTTWTAPAGVYLATLTGCGGGGGGGGGREAPNQTNLWLGGGSGGGGAVLNTATVSVVPGTVYEIVIGAGGTGAAADGDGSDGGDTIFYEQGVGPDPSIIQFYGAGGGKRGGGVTGAALYFFVKGGLPVRMTGEDSYINYTNLVNAGDIVNYLIYPQVLQQQGGYSVPTNFNSGNSVGGGPAPNAFETDARGGSPGADGVDSSTYRGGSGGGGGGMGAFGLAGEGNDGGNGGTAASGGTGGNGTAGGNADANTGSGGGGGGAPGCGLSARGNAGAGGNGGSGLLIITWET